MLDKFARESSTGMFLRVTDLPLPHNRSTASIEKRSITELTTTERESAFRIAVKENRTKTLDAGRPVTEYRDGHVVRVWPDGRVEEVPPVEHAD